MHACVMRPPPGRRELSLPAESEGLFLEHGVNSQYLPRDVPSDHII